MPPWRRGLEKEPEDTGPPDLEEGQLGQQGWGGQESVETLKSFKPAPVTNKRRNSLMPLPSTCKILSIFTVQLDITSIKLFPGCAQRGGIVLSSEPNALTLAKRDSSCCASRLRVVYPAL